MNPTKKMRRYKLYLSTLAFTLLGALFVWWSHQFKGNSAIGASPPPNSIDHFNESSAIQALQLGKRIFRYETFGDEAFWGDGLQLHQAILGQANGGVGNGLSPKAALEAGLKIDVDAVPADIQGKLQAGTLDLNDPGNTLALLKVDAVIGVKGIFGKGGQLQSVGIQCALCHSTVDNSFAANIGKRLDGWPNRDLNVGAIIALAPQLKPVTDLLNVDEATVKQVLSAWGPGKFDAELFLDGKGFRPDGKTAATLLPAAFGLAGVNLHTYTGWGSVTYWNAFVAILEMHGQGTLFDPRLDDSERFPIAAAHQFGHLRPAVDLVTDKLAPLHFYQLSIPAPRPPANSFDAEAAKRGSALFSGKAACNRCHVPPLYTEPGWSMHTGAEIGIDDFQALRSPNGMYRTTPLKGLFTRTKGGFYHDGRFPDLNSVVDHYDTVFDLSLADSEKKDLVEFLKSL